LQAGIVTDNLVGSPTHSQDPLIVQKSLQILALPSNGLYAWHSSRYSSQISKIYLKASCKAKK